MPAPARRATAPTAAARRRPAPASRVPLPDFTDCGYQTREPDADWIAIAHGGGPVRAFDRRMPAFGDALSEAQLAAIVHHLRSFCRDARAVAAR